MRAMVPRVRPLDDGYMERPNPCEVWHGWTTVAEGYTPIVGRV